MKANYIYAPYTPQPIEYHKGKVKRVKHVRRKDVPQNYRKNRFKKFKHILYEIQWILKLARKGILI